MSDLLAQEVQSVLEESRRAPLALTEASRLGGGGRCKKM